MRLLHRLFPATIGLVAIAATVLVQQSPASASTSTTSVDTTSASGGTEAAVGAKAAAALAYPATYGPHVMVYLGALNDKCLNNPNSSKANGTRMIIYTCVTPDVANQDWYFGPQGGNPYYNIWNGASNKCLTVLNASTVNNAPIIQYTCTAGANEEWYPIWEGQSCGLDARCHDVYWVVNRNSEKCLTVTNASQANGATLLQYDCTDNGLLNQLWAI